MVRRGDEWFSDHRRAIASAVCFMPTLPSLDLRAARSRDREKVRKYDRDGDPASCSALGHTFVPLSIEASGAFLSRVFRVVAS